MSTSIADLDGIEQYHAERLRLSGRRLTLLAAALLCSVLYFLWAFVASYGRGTFTGAQLAYVVDYWHRSFMCTAEYDDFKRGWFD